MNASFTPGPWVMTEEGEDDLVICSLRGDFICTPSGDTFGEAIDNARLIAAAPSLYYALTAMLNRDDLSCYAPPMLAQARAAINLATGQEP